MEHDSIHRSIESDTTRVKTNQYVRTEHSQVHIRRWIVAAARHQNYTRGRHFARSPLVAALTTDRTSVAVKSTRKADAE